jgi:hypothetical protein
MPHHHWPGPLLSKQRKEFDLSFLFLGLFSLPILENRSCPRVTPETRRDSWRASLCADEIPNGTGNRHFLSIFEQILHRAPESPLAYRLSRSVVLNFLTYIHPSANLPPPL